MRKKLLRLQVKVSRYRRIRLPRQIRRIKIIGRHPYSVPIMTFAVLIMITLFGYALAKQTNSLPSVQGSKLVIVAHDHIIQNVPTREKTVGGLLAKMHLQIDPGDVVEPAVTTVIDQDQFRINIYRALPVKIVDGSNVNFTFSAATTPRSIATQAGSKVYPEDIVTTDPTQNFVLSGAVGEQVIISRATPVYMNLYGSQLSLRTHAATVKELVKAKGIVLAADDQVTPSLDTALTTNMQVFITRHGTKIESVTETIAMPIQTINDSSLAYGTSAIRQAGSAGQKVTTYQDELSNGVVVGRTVIQTVITQPAVTQIVVVGSSLSGIKGDMALAGIAQSDYGYVDYIISHESGWCPTKPQGTYGTCPPYAGYVPSTGGYGLCQSTPGSKMASAGADWATNPITQLEWCSGYAQSRYGGWYNAYTHWLNYHNW